MKTRTTQFVSRKTQRGMSLLVVAASMVALLGVAALGMDLSALYVARNEAQRAADAAALAGARAFVDSSYISGTVSAGDAQLQARQEAMKIGERNRVGGLDASIAPGDISFNFSVPSNPRITVVVQRTRASGNPIPTTFARIFGFLGEVSTRATAEVYPSSGVTCVKPWLLPNCDPQHSAPGNPNCPGSGYYVDPATGAVANPAPYTSGGAVGQLVTLKPGQPHNAPTPSQFYAIQMPPTGMPICPACATPGGGGAAEYKGNIACCNTAPLGCGVNAGVQLQTGNMVGPTGEGVQCMIHQGPQNCSSNPSSCGQDYLQSTSTYPLSIIGGAGNPNPELRGEVISSSDSIVTIPLYDGHNLSPGRSGNPTITVIGFMQVFVEKVGNPQSTVTGRILNVVGCGAGGGGGGGAGAGAAGPGGGYSVRLVRE